MTSGEPSAKDESVKLILGPYRSGKTRLLLREAIQLKQNAPLSRLLFIVPSARYRKLLKELLAEELSLLASENNTLPGLFGFEIHLFYQVCNLVMKASGQNVKTLPQELRPHILSHAITQLKNREELKTLSSIADFQGSSLAILDLLDEFQRAGISPEDLLSRLESNASAESRYHELALIYRAYWQEMSKLGYFDSKRIAFSARELLYSKQDLKVDFDYLFIDGFDRISHLQAQIFGALSNRAKVTRAAFDYINLDGESFEQNPVAQSPAEYSWKKSSLDELLQNLKPTISIANTTTTTAPQHICLKRSLDKFAEMSEIARSCKAAILERQVAPQEILVTVRSISSYNDAIELAFADAGLDYFIDGSAEVRSTALWRFIKKLLTVSMHDYERSDLIEILRSPYFNLESTRLTLKDISRLDRESYRFRLVGGRQNWRKFFVACRADDIASTLESFFDSLRQPESNLSPDGYVRWIEDLLQKYLLNLPARSGDELRFADLESLAVVRRSLKALILQNELFQAENESYELFMARFIHLVESANYAKQPKTSRHILICSADLAPNRPFKEVYLAGAVEGDFPKRQASKGFVSPDELRRWLSFGADLRNPRGETGFEKALFYSLMERAISGLYLSRPEFNMNGDELIESFFIAELEEKGIIEGKSVAPYEEALHKPYSLREAHTALLWHAGLTEAAELSLRDPAISDYWSQFDDCFASALGRFSEQKQNPFNGCLEDFVAASAINLQLPSSWTATKLNDFGQCPFRFWVSHLLDLRPRDEPKPGLTAMLLGQAYHKALEIFFQDFLKQQQQELSLATEKLIEESLSKAIAWLEARPEFHPGPYWAQEQKEMLFRLTRFINKELERLSTEELQPSMFEVSFGQEHERSFPPLIIRDSDYAIRIRGSIDRMDLPKKTKPVQAKQEIEQDHEETFEELSVRVIDYKTGSGAIPVREAEQGRNLQLPIYALAIQRSILPRSQVNQGLYLSISSGKTSGSLDFRSEKLNHLLTSIEERIKEYLRKIREGNFSVNPNGRDVCQRCDHKRVCRIGEITFSASEEYADA